MPKGRPSLYPCSCLCGCSFSNRQEKFLHKCEFEEMEKKLKVGEKTVPLVVFNPTGDISQAVSQDFGKILKEYDGAKLRAMRKKAQGFQVNVSQFIKEEVCSFLSDDKSCDLSIIQLNAVKSFLAAKRFEFQQKQETVADRVDAIIAESALVTGQETYGLLLGNPPNFDISMEKLLVNHIRQRTLAELEESEGLIEVIIVSFKQTMLFRSFEDEMEKFHFIEDLLDDFIKSKEQRPFIHTHGQMDSQRWGDGDAIDDNTTAGNN